MSQAQPQPDPTPDAAVPVAPAGSGLAPNVAGALAYLFGPITGIIFLLIEKRDPFVRFHAGQSIGIAVCWIIFSVVLMVVSTVLGAIPGVGWLFAILFFLGSLLLGLAGLCLWLWLMYQAFQGQQWEFPWVGPQVRRMLARPAAASDLPR